MKLTSFKIEDGPKLLAETKWDEPIEAKELPTEDKIRFIEFLLSTDTLCNASMLTNVSMLVKGSNLDERDFENPVVIFKDLEEYIDLKQEFLTEIANYRNELAKYHLGALKSLCVVLPDGKIFTPMAYKCTLMSFDLNDLSKIMRNADVNIKDAPLLADAEDILATYTKSNPVFERLCQFVLNDLEKTKEE